MHWRLIARKAPIDETRWVVLDAESSGLDPSTDRLLAVGAVAVRIDWSSRRAALLPGDSFEAFFRQDTPAAGTDVLVHGIGKERQASGAPPQQALQALADYVAQSPLLAFHAGFDRAMLERDWAVHGLRPRNPWLDLEPLCAVSYPQVRGRSLDTWLTSFGIRCLARHRAAADALATGELLLRIWPRVASECRSWRDVVRLAGMRRWVPHAPGP